MPKKKGKAKGKKAEAEGGKKSPKRPTEKEIFETKIEQLREELQREDADLEQHKSNLQEVRSHLNVESDSKISCIAHLKRTLQKIRERRLEAQEKVETERDLAQLADERAHAQLVIAERDARVAKSLFLQQKGEIEGKLSLLEDVRQERKKDLEHRRKAELSLRESRVLFLEKSRDEDKEKLERLLDARQAFARMCREDLGKEFSRVHWELGNPVHAEHQLRENVRLRGECERATQELLEVQDQKRNLKELRKSVELEHEIQSCAEQSADEKKHQQEQTLRRLLNVRQGIQQMAPRADERLSFTERLKPDVRCLPDRVCRMIDQRIDAIRDNESEQFQLADRQSEIDAILKDQMNFKSSLEREIEEKINSNGVMMSALLRSGKVFQSRTKDTTSTEVLNQIRDLLNLSMATN